MLNDILTTSTPTNTPAWVVMAKRPEPRRVKTRLIGELSDLQAARIHAAMLDCVLTRLSALPGQLILALDGGINAPITHPDPDLSIEVPSGTYLMDQEHGDLGDRLGHVWQALGCGPAVFFGVDSPDVPTSTLKSIAPSLTHADAACGPVDDGGYWCLAGRQYTPKLLAGIDWGTPAVYHQTRDAAEQAGLRLHELPAWHDVDDASDLTSLRDRLRDTREPALIRLTQRLKMITQDTHP
jgi:uncharacterized protein